MGSDWNSFVKDFRDTTGKVHVVLTPDGNRVTWNEWELVATQYKRPINKASAPKIVPYKTLETMAETPVGFHIYWDRFYNTFALQAKYVFIGEGMEQLLVEPTGYGAYHWFEESYYHVAIERSI